MDRYIGIDAHSESCTVAVMGPSGKRLRLQVLDTHAKVLIDFLKGIAGNLYVCLEEGQLAEWLVEALCPHVKEVHVVQPKEHSGRKSDADDAWSLAETIRLRANATYVFKPTSQFRSLREAVRAYGVAVKEQTRAKNRLRSLLRSRGVSGIDATIYDPERREQWLRKVAAPYRRRAQWLAEQVDSTTAASEEVEDWLKAEAKKCPEVQRLESLPGFGVVRAAQVVALVVTPHRFRKTRQFWSYAGLAIVTRASGEWKRNPKTGNLERARDVVQTRGLNRNCQPQLKAIFKGAATTVLARSNPLCAHYDRLIAAGTAPHLARLTIARRIAAATLAIWKKQEVYDPNKHRSQDAA